MPALPTDHYHVGVICALHTELAAARGMLEEVHGSVNEEEINDHNTYTGGRMHNHNVVIACLPAGTDGLSAAAIVAKDMLRTFRELRFGLLVGIGGGIPDLDAGIDIRLGDIVVSQPSGIYGGVVQYDKGKSKTDGQWERKGILNRPPTVLLTALQSLQAEHELEDSQVSAYLADMFQRRPKLKTLGYGYPVSASDLLFAATCPHPSGKQTCEGCDVTQTLSRPARGSCDPQIHYGIIASGNQVIKDPQARDELRQHYTARCVEMEAAGLVNEFPCLVIRGICDYANSHKNDVWHRYAAANAAAYAKELLQHVSSKQTRLEKPVTELLGLVTDHLERTREHYEGERTHHQNIESHFERREVRHEDEQAYKCHRTFKTSAYEEQKNINPLPSQGTCRWVLDNNKFKIWQSEPRNDLLWISADPGCGKSVLSRLLIDQTLVSQTASRDYATKAPSICYFFFKDNEVQDRLATALSAILHQLFSQQPRLIRCAMPAWKRNGEKIRSEVDEMWRILRSRVQDPASQPVVCVLDALDEACDGDRRRLISLLCQFYTATSSQSPTHSWLKFVVTSRPYDDIQDAFHLVLASSNSIRLRGEDENDIIHDEIDMVVHQKVNELSRELRLTKETTLELERMLLQMEHRTYLWLHLAMDDVERTLKDSLHPDIQAVDSLPSSVEEAYTKILDRVTDKI